MISSQYRVALNTIRDVVRNKAKWLTGGPLFALSTKYIAREDVMFSHSPAEREHSDRSRHL